MKTILNILLRIFKVDTTDADCSESVLVVPAVACVVGVAVFAASSGPRVLLLDYPRPPLFAPVCLFFSVNKRANLL